jgi:hypothetical protein
VSNQEVVAVLAEQLTRPGVVEPEATATHVFGLLAGEVVAQPSGNGRDQTSRRIATVVGVVGIGTPPQHD